MYSGWKRTNAVSSCGLEMSEGFRSPACLGATAGGTGDSVWRSAPVVDLNFEGVFAGVIFRGNAPEDAMVHRR